MWNTATVLAGVVLTGAMVLHRLQENAGEGKDRQSQFYMTQKPDSRCFSSACNCEKISHSLPSVCPITRTQFLLLPRSAASPVAYLPSSDCCLRSPHSSVLIKPFTGPCPQSTFFCCLLTLPMGSVSQEDELNCVDVILCCLRWSAVLCQYSRAVLLTGSKGSLVITQWALWDELWLVVRKQASLPNSQPCSHTISLCSCLPNSMHSSWPVIYLTYKTKFLWMCLPAEL